MTTGANTGYAVKANTRKGAEIILEYLIKERVPYLLGLCGHGDVGLMDAAFDRQDRIKTISTHNEQIAGFMADAFYRVSRQPVATFTSCGPGSVNIQMALACAFFDSSPILAICTQRRNDRGLGERSRGLRQPTGAKFQARVSSDSPRLNAFCRVAPSVRFRVLAMLAALVFFFASVFKVRTCSAVHARLDAFLTI